MKKMFGIYRTFLQTLNPASYEGLSESKMKNTFAYFFNLIFQSMIVLVILSLPMIIAFPGTIESEFSKISTFTITSNFSTTSPLAFPEKNPMIEINYGNATPPSANVILDHDTLYYGFLFSNYQRNISSYGNFVQHKTGFSTIIALLLLLMLPTMLLIAYFYFLVKFLAIAFIAAVLGLLVAAIIGRKISFTKLFNTSMYGISATVLLSMIFFAIRFSFYYIEYLPLIIYMITSIYNNGEKIDSKKKNTFVEIK